jgi:putative membrane protein
MTRSDRRILLLAGVLLLLLVFGFSGSVGMMRGYRPGMMGWYGYQTLGGWAWLAPVGMGLGMLIFWGLLIAVVVLLARSIARERDAPSESARAVLDRRFAAGEITEEQYAKMRSVLDQESAPGGGSAQAVAHPNN